MRIVFGLGNPGAEYENTYHNAGLLSLRELKEILDKEKAVTTPMKTGKAFAYWKYGELVLAAARPDGSLYMNQSGIPVQEALAYFKASPADLVLLHDDSDLPLGVWKLEKERGSAGHHGVESVMETLGTDGFWRGRIGIRPPEPEGRRRKADEFVLARIGKDDREVLRKSFQELVLKVMENV